MLHHHHPRLARARPRGEQAVVPQPAQRLAHGAGEESGEGGRLLGLGDGVEAAGGGADHRIGVADGRDGDGPNADFDRPWGAGRIHIARLVGDVQLDAERPGRNRRRGGEQRQFAGFRGTAIDAAGSARPSHETDLTGGHIVEQEPGDHRHEQRQRHHSRCDQYGGCRHRPLGCCGVGPPSDGTIAQTRCKSRAGTGAREKAQEEARVRPENRSRNATASSPTPTPTSQRRSSAMPASPAANPVPAIEALSWKDVRCGRSLTASGRPRSRAGNRPSCGSWR